MFDERVNTVYDNNIKNAFGEMRKHRVEQKGGTFETINHTKLYTQKNKLFRLIHVFHKKSFYRKPDTYFSIFFFEKYTFWITY